LKTKYFDCLFSCAIDVMHGVFMGLQKNLDTYWFSSKSKFRHLPCFARVNIKDIDIALADLNRFLSPNITYNVKKIDKNHRWKSLQRETWFFYFGPE